MMLMRAHILYLCKRKDLKPYLRYAIMEQKKYFFAVDLGATSGRTIIGSINDGKFELEEVTRFPNNLIEQGGHYYWDIYALYFEIIKGLKEVARRGLEITSIGIDTWGVDFVFIGNDGAILRNPRAYRDPITFDAMDDYLRHVVSRREVYDITGIQFMNFNSIFQLYAMKREQNAAFLNASKILFVPDALSWMLTGNEVCEYTIASTSQLLDPRTKQLDERLLASLGLSRSKFGKMVQPGTVVGVLTDEVQRLLDAGLPPDCTAMQAIGYKEAVLALRGELTGEEALDLIRQGSRRYAKRQITWFGRWQDAHRILWERVPDFEAALRSSTAFLQSRGYHE